MNRAPCVCLLLWICCAFCARALEVECVAGSLADQVGEGAGVRELKVTGTLDVRDFEFISSRMVRLAHLDMGDAAVAAYTGSPTFLGRTACDADVLPECALMCAALESVVLPRSLVEIADGALGGSGIRSIVIPGGVKRIGDSAFGNCVWLEEVIVPPGVEMLGRNLFKGCTALRSAVVNASADRIPDGMFEGCVQLAEVRLPEDVKYIGEGAFAGCKALTRIDFPAAVEEIADKAFHGSGLTAADMAGCRNLTRIGRWAFASLPALATVLLPPSLTELEAGAFFNDVELAQVRLPQRLLLLGDFSLARIAAEDECVMSETEIRSVGSYALAGWENMLSVKLPASLRYLGDGAMAGWTSLERISAENLAVVPELGEGVWRGIVQEGVTLCVPAETADAYRDTPQWQDFNIVATGAADLSAPATGVLPDAPTATARFEGRMLVVEASAPIYAMQLSDLQAHACTIRLAAPSRCAAVDASAWGDSVVLLRLIFAEGTAVTLKLRR